MLAWWVSGHVADRAGSSIRPELRYNSNLPAKDDSPRKPRDCMSEASARQPEVGSKTRAIPPTSAAEPPQYSWFGVPKGSRSGTRSAPLTTILRSLMRRRKRQATGRLRPGQVPGGQLLLDLALSATMGLIGEASSQQRADQQPLCVSLLTLLIWYRPDGDIVSW